MAKASRKGHKGGIIVATLTIVVKICKGTPIKYLSNCSLIKCEDNVHIPVGDHHEKHPLLHFRLPIGPNSRTTWEQNLTSYSLYCVMWPILTIRQNCNFL